jgi:succinoglycan biosynthesis transport protein ExoP
MNTTDTQHAANKAPSAAESQLLHSSLLMMAQAHGENAASGPPALSATPTLTGLLHALRRRWPLALGVAVGATAVAVLAVFFFMPPKYNVVLRMRVVAKQAGAEDVEFPVFKANMEALVRDPLVLNAALNDKASDGREIKDLDLVRGKGMNVNEWLEKNLKTDYNLGPEVLRVTLAADQPEEAAELLNAVAKAFLGEYAQTERTKKQSRLDELRKQKDRIEEDLRKYRGNLLTQMNTLSVKDRDAMLTQQGQWLDKLRNAEATRRITDDEIAKAEGKSYTAKARLKNLDKQQVPDEVLFELFSRDQTVQGFDKKIAELEDRIGDYFAKYQEPYASQYATPLKHEKIKLRKMKRDRETALKPDIEQRWRKGVRADLDHQIAVADEEQQSYTRRRESLLKEIQELERNVKESGPGGANKPAGIQAIEDKIKQAEKALEYTGQKISDVELEALPARVIPITRAAPPIDKDRTQQTKIAGGGGLGIFMLALFGVAFFEFRSRKICQTDEVTHGLGLKVVGTVPAMPTRSKKPSAHDSAVEAQWLSQLQESVDAIRTVILHQARSEALHVILVTSANSGEGKTTLATQLAASLARGWKRTLIIDADLRHPAAHTLFDTPQEPGLAEVLRGEVEPADAIRATAYGRLWVLPAGNGDNHAIQALAQDNVRTFFEQLKQQYDFIIIDSPPVLPVTDSLLIGQHVDGVLFAILSDVSRAPAVYAAQQKLAPLNVPMLGAVVLGTEQEFSDKNYRYAMNMAK